MSVMTTFCLHACAATGWLHQSVTRRDYFTEEGRRFNTLDYNNRIQVVRYLGQSETVLEGAVGSAAKLADDIDMPVDFCQVVLF